MSGVKKPTPILLNQLHKFVKQGFIYGSTFEGFFAEVVQLITSTLQSLSAF